MFMQSILLLTATLFLSINANASSHEYKCFPSRKNPDQSIYFLKTQEEGIALGYRQDELKSAKKVENRNKNWLSDLNQYSGAISDLRGEGYLEAYLAHELLEGGLPLRNGGKGGQMALAWGGAGPFVISSYLCISK